MKRILRKYLVPHAGNDHKPHLLRSRAIIVMLLLILIGEIAYVGGGVLRTLPGSSYIAAILPAVLVDLTNKDRSAHAARALTINPLLEQAAALKANDMAVKGYFAHTSPEGLTPWHWFDTVGYRYAAAGENLAVNFTDSADVENAWMNSEGHRANILNSVYSEIGIATAKGAYKGQEVIFVVQMFGRPREVDTAAQALAPEPMPEADQEPTQVTIPTTPPTARPSREEASSSPITEQKPANRTTTVAAATIQNSAPAQGLPAPKYTTLLTRLLSMPRVLMNSFLALLAGVISVVFVYWLVKRFRFAHPVMIAESIVFLTIVFALIFVNDYLSLLGAHIL
jgi:uncharacterized protein YkwD